MPVQTKLVPIEPGAMIVGIDPGETTGVCQIRYGGSRVFEVISAVALPWERRFRLDEYISGMDYVVIERFSLYASHKDTMVNNEFPSVRIIGIVDYICYLRNLDDRMYFQPASVMGNVKVLPEHEKYIPPGEHARDAYKHIRYFILVNRPSQLSERLLKG